MNGDGRVCSVDGCERPGELRGWCKMHYTRWQRHGDPTKRLRLMGAPAEERFWLKVDRRGPDECWPWIGGHDSGGYGSFGEAPGKPTRAHRFSYELLVGPIPDGLVIDHLCRNRGCVNPTHLEPVTNEENLRRSPIRGKKPLKTHCAQGHPFDEENTYYSAKQRVCRTCSRAASYRAWQRRRAAANA